MNISIPKKQLSLDELNKMVMGHKMTQRQKRVFCILGLRYKDEYSKTKANAILKKIRINRNADRDATIKNSIPNLVYSGAVFK